MISKAVAAQCIKDLLSVRTKMPSPEGVAILVDLFAEEATDDQHALRMTRWLHHGVRGDLLPAWFREAADATREAKPVESRGCDRPGCEEGWIRREDLRGVSSVHECECRKAKAGPEAVA